MLRNKQTQSPATKSTLRTQQDASEHAPVPSAARSGARAKGLRDRRDVGHGICGAWAGRRGRVHQPFWRSQGLKFQGHSAETSLNPKLKPKPWSLKPKPQRLEVDAASAETARAGEHGMCMCCVRIVHTHTRAREGWGLGFELGLHAAAGWGVSFVSYIFNLHTHYTLNLDIYYIGSDAVAGWGISSCFVNV